MSLRNKLLEDILDCCEVLGTNLDELKAFKNNQSYSKVRWFLIYHLMTKSGLYTADRIGEIIGYDGRTVTELNQNACKKYQSDQKFKIGFEDFEVNLLLHKAKKSLAA